MKIGALVGNNEVGKSMYDAICDRLDFAIFENEFSTSELENSDIVFLLWWPKIVKYEIRKLARVGFINMHPSYLPYCRGKDPYFWSIIEDVPFGLTLHFIDDGIDTGDIIFQHRIEIDDFDTGESLRNKSVALAPQFIADHFDAIKSGVYMRIRQPQLGSYHRTGDMERAIQFLWNDKEIRYDLIRASTFKQYNHGSRIMRDGKLYDVRIDINEVLPNG